jgi:hypothetical protein
MSKWDTFRRKLLSGQSDKNIKFSELISFLKRLEFIERVEGDHHILVHADIVEIINLQPRHDGAAKPYQVRQVRKLIITYDLQEDPNEQV